LHAKALSGSLTAMYTFDYVINALASHGLFVILDNHMTDAAWCCDDGSAPPDGTYDHNDVWWQSAGNSSYSSGEVHWETDWATMVARYANQPAIIGVDLRNEPRGPSYWGGTSNGLPNGVAVEASINHGNPPGCPDHYYPASDPGVDVACDWRWAAENEGENVLSLNPNLLVFVEGVNLATDLTGAYTSPIVLSGHPTQLVYSAHVYEGSGYCINSAAQAFSQCPQNSNTTFGSYQKYCQTDYHTSGACPLTKALDSQWGYLAESGDQFKTITPIWVGEFGTTAWSKGATPTSPDTPVFNFPQWFLNLGIYIKQTGFGYAYWALNGTEDDSTFTSPPRVIDDFEPYGILNTNWSTRNWLLWLYLIGIY
jgi:hypothetical protein